MEINNIEKYIGYLCMLITLIPEVRVFIINLVKQLISKVISAFKKHRLKKRLVTTNNEYVSKYSKYLKRPEQGTVIVPSGTDTSIVKTNLKRLGWSAKSIELL